MKTVIPRFKFLPVTLLSFVLLGWLLGACPASAQGTAFTYQGRLTFNGSSANASLDLTFGLFDDPLVGNQIGSTITNLDLSVSNGLVTVVLDFGTSAFPGADRWLEIGVRTNGSAAGFTTLSPRQKLTAAPYSMTAANFSGAIADSQLSANVALLNGANVFTGPISSIVGGTTNYMLPSGLIALWSGSPASIPAGWVLCDGNNGTPDLRDRFVVGAAGSYAVGSTGGTNSHTHIVAMGGNATDAAGAHTHTLVGSTDPESSHTHGAGSYGTAANTTGSESSHTHGGGTLAFPRAVPFGTWNGGTVNDWVINCGSATAASSASIPGSSWQGATGAGSAHSHTIPAMSVTGTSGAGSAHSHTLTSASTASAGAHTHTISFSVTSGSADSRPPYYALCYIMKL
jgi:hypothetical protein